MNKSISDVSPKPRTEARHRYINTETPTARTHLGRPTLPAAHTQQLGDPSTVHASGQPGKGYCPHTWIQTDRRRLEDNALLSVLGVSSSTSLLSVCMCMKNLSEQLKH